MGPKYEKSFLTYKICLAVEKLEKVEKYKSRTEAKIYAQNMESLLSKFQQVREWI